MNTVDIIPKELGRLTTHNRWLVSRPVERNGKITKPPFNPVSGELAGVNDSSSWGSYWQALNRIRSGAFRFAGYVLGDPDGLAGIDLDHVVLRRDDEAHCMVTEEAYQIIQAVGSYVELSPSGTGVHILFYGRLPEDFEQTYKHKTVKPDGTAFEIYDRDRYFTITGDTVGTPHELRAIDPEALKWILNTFFRSSSPVATSSEGGNGTSYREGSDDSDLWLKMFRSARGTEIRALFSGDLTAHEGDESSADLAMCNYLGYWTNYDPVRMDRMFRQTGLMRDKWNRKTGTETYGILTIRKACAGHTPYHEYTQEEKREYARRKAEERNRRNG